MTTRRQMPSSSCSWAVWQALRSWKIEEELASLQAKIENWEAILADDARVLAIVKEELLEMKKRFGDERRTEIQSVTGEVDIE